MPLIRHRFPQSCSSQAGRPQRVLLALACGGWLLGAGGAWAASPTAAELAPDASAPATSVSAQPQPANDLANTTSPAAGQAADDNGGKDKADGFSPVSGGAAFTIRIEAPADIRSFLDRYLELKRYQKVRDLDNAELQRLLALSEANIRQLLGTQGYFTPDITQTLHHTGVAATPDTAITPEVQIQIDPGPITKIAQADLRFDGAITHYAPARRQLNRIRQRWALPVGEDFTQAGWSSAKAQALQSLQALRFPTARLVASRAEIDPDSNSAQLVASYDSGPLYRYGPVQIKGQERYDPVIIERLARIEPGKEYRQRDLLDAQQRLLDSGYYTGAFVSIDTSADAKPEAAPVLVQVQEAKLQKLVLGVGASTDRGPRLSIDHIHNRVPGLGWRALSKLQVDKVQQAFSTSLLSPPDNDLWRWLVNGSYSREKYTDMTQRSQQVRVGRTKLQQGIDRTYYLQYDHSSADYVDGGKINAQALSANYVWTYRKFNSTTYPTRGYGVGLELGGGMTLHPRHTPFTRIAARYLGFFSLDGNLGDNLRSSLPVPSEVKAAVTGGAARVDEAAEPLLQAPTQASRRKRQYGELVLRLDAAGVFTKTEAIIPSNLLFLSGGNATVRGYAYQELGVTNASGLTEPGRYMLAGSVEYRRPLVLRGKPTDWDTVAYVDAGSVANSPAALHPLKVGVGAGVLWRSPVGPVQMSLAYGLQSKKLRLHMNLGFNF